MTTSSTSELRILFLTESREDYLADSLLHGLISLGHKVVDYPRKSILYQSIDSSTLGNGVSVRGHGFTLYGTLDERPVDRSFVIQRLENNFFNLVVLGQVWRQWGQLLDLAPLLQTVPVVLLDGDDDTRLFHRSGTRLRRYGWQSFPIQSGSCFYFKRELQALPAYSRFCKVLPASFSIPSEKIRSSDLACKHQQLASHCVDEEVANACRLHASYAFASEHDYYNDMASSRFAVTTKRGGWDCLRHYEISAAGALPCFRELESKPAACAPHGLKAGVNCLSYQNWSDLQAKLEFLDTNPMEYNRLLQASGDWVRQFTTAAAAQRLLDSVLGQ